jgi:hypothetical protein
MLCQVHNVWVGFEFTTLVVINVSVTDYIGSCKSNYHAIMATMTPKRFYTLTVKCTCRTAIKSMFPYFNLCLSVQLNCLLCSFTSVSFLSNRRFDIFLYCVQCATVSVPWGHRLPSSQWFFFALTWVIRYIYYWNLQFLNNVIIIKS